MDERTKRHGLTPTTLILTGVVFASLFVIAIPIGKNFHERGVLTQTLHKAKGIALVCKLYASDHNGEYPFFKDPGKQTGAATSSNEAFDLLIPTYMPDERIFFVKGSAWSYKLPDGKPPLGKGENHWAYFGGLGDTSNPSYPLVAEGFVEGSERNPVYSFDEKVKGGIKKRTVVVIRVDQSGNVGRVPSSGFIARSDHPEKNLFQPIQGEWLDGAVVLNPK